MCLPFADLFTNSKGWHWIATTRSAMASGPRRWMNTVLSQVSPFTKIKVMFWKTASMKEYIPSMAKCVPRSNRWILKCCKRDHVARHVFDDCIKVN